MAPSSNEETPTAGLGGLCDGGLRGTDRLDRRGDSDEPTVFGEASRGGVIRVRKRSGRLETGARLQGVEGATCLNGTHNWITPLLVA